MRLHIYWVIEGRIPLSPGPRRLPFRHRHTKYSSYRTNGYVLSRPSHVQRFVSLSDISFSGSNLVDSTESPLNSWPWLIIEV